MKTYEVEGHAEIIYSTFIEAKNRKEAEKLFKEQLEMEGMIVLSSDVNSVEPVDSSILY